MLHSIPGAALAAPSMSSAPTAPAAATRSRDASSIGGTFVAFGLLVFAAVWLGELAYTSLSPPVDNIEQLTWVRALEWGYYKHPPVPTWLIWLPARLFGASAGTSYALGAATTLGAVWTLWRLLKRLRGGTYAGIALLAALCITYYNDRLFYYNHNVVLLLFTAAAAAVAWPAFTTGKLRWWCALGLLVGLATLSKYQAAVTMASLSVFAIQQRAWRHPAQRRGILWAALIALSVCVPHIYWLRTHDFGPIQYALDSSLGARLGMGVRLVEAPHWLADQVLNRLSPAWALLAFTALRVRGSRSPLLRLCATPTATGQDPSRAFLLIWGIVPLLAMPMVGLAVGAELQLQWGTPFLLFAVPAIMELAPREFWQRAQLDMAFRIFLWIQALLLALNFVTSPRGALSLRDHHWATFDSAALARRVAAPARAALGGPIVVVSGSTAIAGALALRLPEHPLVLIEGRYDHSPWVDPTLVGRCGVLELGATLDLRGGTPVGPEFAGLAWRVKPRESSAAPCPTKSE